MKQNKKYIMDTDFTIYAEVNRYCQNVNVFNIVSNTSSIMHKNNILMESTDVNTLINVRDKFINNTSKYNIKQFWTNSNINQSFDEHLQKIVKGTYFSKITADMYDYNSNVYIANNCFFSMEMYEWIPITKNINYRNIVKIKDIKEYLSRNYTPNDDDMYAFKLKDYDSVIVGRYIKPTNIYNKYDRTSGYFEVKSAYKSLMKYDEDEVVWMQKLKIAPLFDVVIDPITYKQFKSEALKQYSEDTDDVITEINKKYVIYLEML